MYTVHRPVGLCTLERPTSVDTPRESILSEYESESEQAHTASCISGKKHLYKVTGSGTRGETRYFQAWHDEDEITTSARS